MTQRRGELTDKSIRALKWEGKTFRKGDGGGRNLYIEVQEPGKYWRQKYAWGGKGRWLYLGAYPDTGLSEARDRCDANRRLVRDGVDPAEAKREQKRNQRRSVDSEFKKVAQEWFDARAADKSPSHKTRTQAYIDGQLSPLHRKPVSDIVPADVTAIMDRINERGTHDTARRVLSLLQQILKYAYRRGYFIGETLPTVGQSETLPKAKTVNRAAVTDADELGEVIKKLWSYNGTPQIEAALKLQPLLACRPGELRNAEWTEIEWEAKRWLIPGSKMKGGADFIVPLAPQVLEIFEWLKLHTGHRRFVFASPQKPRQPISDASIGKAMRQAGVPSSVATPHGFRASFRTLAEEKLGFDVAVIELQLAHAIRGPLGEAYGRAQFMEDRIRLMSEWAAYLQPKKGSN